MIKWQCTCTMLNIYFKCLAVLKNTLKRYITQTLLWILTHPHSLPIFFQLKINLSWPYIHCACFINELSILHKITSFLSLQSHYSQSSSSIENWPKIQHLIIIILSGNNVLCCNFDNKFKYCCWTIVNELWQKWNPLLKPLIYKCE